MSNKNPGILRNLRIKRVALVDAGANLDEQTQDGAHIMLYKSAVRKDGPPIGDVHVAAPACIGADCPGCAQCEKSKKEEKSMSKTYSAKNLIKALFAAVTETDVAKRDQLLKDAEMEMAAPPEQVQEKPAEKPAEAPNHAANLHKALGEAIAGYGPGPHPPEHPVHAMKALHETLGSQLSGVHDMPEEKNVVPASDNVTKRMTDLEKRNSDLEKSNKELLEAIVVEKNNRLDSEMTLILKSFKSTPFDLTTDVAKFRKMKEEAPEAYERTMSILKAQDAMLSDSTLFKNVGTSRSGGSQGGAWAQIEAKADAMVEKNANLTREQAIEKVMLSFPKLVAESRAEMQ